MSWKRFSVEQINNHLREPGVMPAQKMAVGATCCHIWTSEQSNYRLRREYGVPKVDRARQPKGREQENARLKPAVADMTVGKLILKEATDDEGRHPGQCRRMTVLQRTSRLFRAGRYHAGAARRRDLEPVRCPASRARADIRGLPTAEAAGTVRHGETIEDLARICDFPADNLAAIA